MILKDVVQSSLKNTHSTSLKINLCVLLTQRLRKRTMQRAWEADRVEGCLADWATSAGLNGMLLRGVWMVYLLVSDLTPLHPHRQPLGGMRGTTVGHAEKVLWSLPRDNCESVTHSHQLEMSTSHHRTGEYSCKRALRHQSGSRFFHILIFLNVHFQKRLNNSFMLFFLIHPLYFYHSSPECLNTLRPSGCPARPAHSQQIIHQQLLWEVSLFLSSRNQRKLGLSISCAGFS